MAKVETVEIQDGDTFICNVNSIMQRRGDEDRVIRSDYVGEWATPARTTGSSMSRMVAAAAIKGMGHEVKHVTPQPSYPVVRVAELTHGVRCCGAIRAIGTLEQCLSYDDEGSIVLLDWTGVGDRPPTTIKDSGPMPDPKPAPDFKVGDVVRGRVVGNRWQVKYKDGCEPDLYSNEASARNAARTGTGGTVTRVALVEVEVKQ
jgi:hypothetical protein